MASQKHRSTLNVNMGILTYAEQVASVHGVEWQVRTLDISREVARFEQWLEKGLPFAVVGTTRNGKLVSHYALSQEESYVRDSKGVRNRMDNFYWRAYRRTAGKLIRRYVGVTITLARLRELASELDHERYDATRNTLEVLNEIR